MERSSDSGRQPLILAREEIGWRAYPLPATPPPGSVRIRTRASLISSGTEMRLYRGEPMAAIVWDAMCDLDRFAPGTPRRRSDRGAADAARFPCGVGYNNVGEVIALGEGVESLAIGDHVFTQARHCELFDIDAWGAVPIPAGISDAGAAPAYLATLGLHALRQMRWMPGEPVVVVGLGLIGLCAALIADALGAELILIGRSEERTRLARSLLPAALVHDPALPWSEFEQRVAELAPRVAIEAVGGAQALQLGISVLHQGGRLAALGMHGGSVGSLLSEEFYENEVSIVGTSNDPYGPARPRAGFTTLGNVAFVLDLISRHRLDLEGVCTDTRPAHDIGAAYAAIASREDPGTIGVLLDWSAQNRSPVQD